MLTVGWWPRDRRGSLLWSRQPGRAATPRRSPDNNLYPWLLRFLSRLLAKLNQTFARALSKHSAVAEYAYSTNPRSRESKLPSSTFLIPIDIDTSIIIYLPAIIESILIYVVSGVRSGV